jgi:hypothetical protein
MRFEFRVDKAADALLTARHAARLTLAQVAERMGTHSAT